MLRFYDRLPMALKIVFWIVLCAAIFFLLIALNLYPTA